MNLLRATGREHQPTYFGGDLGESGEREGREQGDEGREVDQENEGRGRAAAFGRRIPGGVQERGEQDEGEGFVEHASAEYRTGILVKGTRVVWIMIAGRYRKGARSEIYRERNLLATREVSAANESV